MSAKPMQLRGTPKEGEARPVAAPKATVLSVQKLQVVSSPPNPMGSPSISTFVQTSMSDAGNDPSSVRNIGLLGPLAIKSPKLSATSDPSRRRHPTNLLFSEKNDPGEPPDTLFAIHAFHVPPSNSTSARDWHLACALRRSAGRAWRRGGSPRSAPRASTPVRVRRRSDQPPSPRAAWSNHVRPLLRPSPIPCVSLLS